MMDSDFSFGLDPVDFRHRLEHPKLRFVSHFLVSNNFSDIPSGEIVCYHAYLVSWNNALTFRRFLNLFPNLYYTESSKKIDSKLIRFDLDRYYRKLKDDFNLDSTFDDISWNDLDDSGIVRLRSKKSNK